MNKMNLPPPFGPAAPRAPAFMVGREITLMSISIIIVFKKKKKKKKNTW
jgi:hypothetical protein